MHTKKNNLIKHKKKSRSRRGGFWPFDNNSQQQQQQPQQSSFIYKSDQLSIQSIPLTGYKQIGIIHMSESAGINAVRQFGTNLSNMFGSKGFDNFIYDKLRNQTFKKLISMISPTNKVFNIRIDIETNSKDTGIFLHLYGDLCEQTGSTVPTTTTASGISQMPPPSTTVPINIPPPTGMSVIPPPMPTVPIKIPPSTIMQSTASSAIPN